MNENVKKCIRISGIVAAAAAGASLSAYLTTKILVKTAVDRDGPRVMQRAGNLLARTQKDNQFLAELDAAAKRLEEKKSETVTVTSLDGIPLVGHFIPSEKTQTGHHRHEWLAIFLDEGFWDYVRLLGGKRLQRVIRGATWPEQQWRRLHGIRSDRTLRCLELDQLGYGAMWQ